MSQIKGYLIDQGFLPFKEIALWEMFLIGFVRIDKAKFLKNPDAKYKATGIGGILGNKGGMNITFEYMGTIFSVLNCHLVHSAKNFIKRNAMLA